MDEQWDDEDEVEYPEFDEEECGPEYRLYKEQQEIEQTVDDLLDTL